MADKRNQMALGPWMMLDDYVNSGIGAEYSRHIPIAGPFGLEAGLGVDYSRIPDVGDAKRILMMRSVFALRQVRNCLMIGS